MTTTSIAGSSPPRVGFTGGRRPITPRQDAWLRRTLAELYTPGAELHHGDCVGKDEAAHAIALELGYRVVVHPPTMLVLRAFCGLHDDFERVEVLPPQPYLTRNDTIVARVYVLVAVPDTAAHKRSGTWYTVRRWRAYEPDRPLLVCPYYHGVPAGRPLHERD